MKAKINFPQGFDKNGELAEEQLFTHSFNTLPHKTIFRLNQDSNIDLSKIDLKSLQEAFPSAEIRYIRYQNKETTSCVDDVESGEEFDSFFVSTSSTLSVNNVVPKGYLFFHKASGRWISNSRTGIQITELK